MFLELLLIVAATAVPPEQSIQSKNDEFIFTQYPPRALAAGEQGSVRFRAEVDAKGNVLSCKVTAGSGYKRLDRETCDLIVDHATFKPTLDSDGKAREAVHDGVVNWRIPGSSSATQIASIGGKPMDEITCKRSTKTGSLVANSRVCMTRREWTAQAERNQADWGDLQGRRGYSVCGGPNLPPC
jgi:periplasmic protein TonB